MDATVSNFDIFEANPLPPKTAKQQISRAAKLLYLLLEDFVSIQTAINNPRYEQRVLISSTLQEPEGSRGDWRPLDAWLQLVDSRADSWGNLAVTAMNHVRGVDALWHSIGLPVELGQLLENAEPPYDRDPRRATCQLLAELLDFHGVKRPSDRDILAGTGV